ncbi:hypothetical protein EJ05DRAFT_497991 [Pseudovirgaria hyperparasitica]|uniref:Concanavalin A-like lectin/glucanase n=1 Tax=Pseudovirgaria hyperparasitica TaxID=470096 RepID=A0A6A6WH94_9PEZI|nr:uncharacterized protein EJ05DRAFT_497991 [Pseudovirgaria hyperparasitica]KAF2761440.1 hypothetical protein EJ05DRAFT_497991 [Pseudovirgaria hyperparasitica]
MANSTIQWTYKNEFDNTVLSPFKSEFTITAPPATDIWRPAFDKDNFTAPFLYTTILTSKFVSMRVCVSGPWKTRYDQGGLVITFPVPGTGPLRWVKAGIEFEAGAPNLGVVATDRLSDWSLSPIADRQNEAEFELERDGMDLWVYVVESGVRRALRQVTWAFNEGVGEEIDVGLYAAKPTYEPEGTGGDGTLLVTFKGFRLITTDGELE